MPLLHARPRLLLLLFVYWQLMERAKTSGSLDLPPELLDVMQHLQQGTDNLSVTGTSRRTSIAHTSGAGRYSINSRVRGSDCALTKACVHTIHKPTHAFACCAVVGQCLNE